MGMQRFFEMVLKLLQVLKLPEVVILEILLPKEAHISGEVLPFYDKWISCM